MRQNASSEYFVHWDHAVPAEPKEVANGLRSIASEIERNHLTLISIYSTGFGAMDEACLQVIATTEPATP